MNLKHIGLLLAFLAITLAVVAVGQRLSTEIAAVVVGVVCGVTASVPVSLGLLLALGMGHLPGQRSSNQPTAPARPDAPLVAAPTTRSGWNAAAPPAGRSPQLGPAPWRGRARQTAAGRERFRIVGREDESRLPHD